MKFPVFAKGAEPSIDRRIQRKSMSYITEEVGKGRADWVDCGDRRKGIICREMLHLGFKPLAPEPEKRLYGLAPSEVSGLAMRVVLTEAGRDVQRFRARNLINRRTREFVAIVYSQRLPAAEIVPALASV
jgi:hypothetical protein